MYKRFNGIICFCLIIIGLSLSYNKLNSQTFGLSISGGIVASQVDGDELAGYNKPGPFLSLNVAAHLKAKLDLEIGISYVFRGSQSQLFPDNSYIQQKINLQYIDVPLTIHYKDWLEPELNFYRMDFYGGLYYGRLISVTAEYIGDYDNHTDDSNKNEIGIVLGGGYSFNPHNAFGVKWCRGLNNLYDSSPTGYSRSLINRFLQFYYQYKF
ncbi:MAG TPA: porin family protein [Saprospiraceae bacterium]|nr:porin family protein [Saprospiraceae bacterium]